MSVTQVQTIGITNDAVTTEKINFQNALVPVGGIIMWTGTTIPTGWALCNGNNGTPNLTNRFIVGAANVSKTGTTSQVGSSPYDPGDTGGSANSTLVSHSHTATTSATSTVSDPGHTHTIMQGAIDSFAPTNRVDASSTSGFGGSYGDSTDAILSSGTGITVSTSAATSISTEGASATGANLPPYYALAFIMRTS